MAQITLDPGLMNGVNYDIWLSTEDHAWICVARELPFLGSVSGFGDDPETALKECRIALQAAFDSFNR